MGRARLVQAAAALVCASVVLTGCTSDDDPAESASTETATTVTETASESDVPASDEPFDITLVPATKPPADDAAAAPTDVPLSGAPEASAPAAPGESAVPASPSVSPTPAGPPVKPGRVFVFVKSVDTAARTLTYDEAQFLTGDAANKAAAQDKQEVPVPNDYYIRNVNKRLRTVPVAADAVVLGNIAMTQQQQPTPVTLEQLGQFAAANQAAVVGFWLTITADRQIVKIEEQFVP